MPSFPSDVYGALVDHAGVTPIELMGAIVAGAAYPYAPDSFPAEWRERLEQVERFIVGFSGGKDSIACFLFLLEMGISRDRIELWHHRIDPPDRPFMDWPCTEAYCRSFAEAFGVRLLFSGKVTGFEGEMLRDNAPTGPTFFETPNGETRVVGGDSPKRSTRLRFPQVSADLSVRWCSSYLKIDIAARVFSNDPRFASGTFCLLTGERAQESASRAKYNEIDLHRSNTQRRRVYQWRPVHKWTEEHVWEIMRRWCVNPHPAYRLGFGRVSCMSCIFGNREQWATVKALNPAQFEKIAEYERAFGSTINPLRGIREMVKGGYQVGRQKKQRAGTDTTKIENLISDATTQLSADRIAVIQGVLADLDGVSQMATLPDAVLEDAEKRLRALRGASVPGAHKGPKTWGDWIGHLFKTIRDLHWEPKIAAPARPFLSENSGGLAQSSQKHEYSEPVIVLPSQWMHPAGAFKHDGGPI